MALTPEEFQEELARIEEDIRANPSLYAHVLIVTIGNKGFFITPSTVRTCKEKR